MLEIHNIYFMKKDFSEKQAKDWIIAHNYKLKKKDIPKVKKWSVQRIINALRSDNNSYLWNKEMNLFNNEDYKLLQKYENSIFNNINCINGNNNVSIG